MTRRRTKRTWHIAQRDGVWKVFDPELRQYLGRFATADAAKAWMVTLKGQQAQAKQVQP